MKRSKEKATSSTKKAKDSQLAKANSENGAAGSDEPKPQASSSSKPVTRKGRSAKKQSQSLDPANDSLSKSNNAQPEPIVIDEQDLPIPLKPVPDQAVQRSEEPMEVEQQEEDDEYYEDDLEYEEEQEEVISKEELDYLNQSDSKEGIPTTTLSGDEIVKFMDKQIDETISVLSIHSPTITRLLLNVFKWDKQTLLLKFFDSSPEVFDKLTKSKLFLERSSDFVLLSHGSCIVENIDECQICFDPVGPGTCIMYGTSCGHSFCEGCWKDFIRIHIRENGILSKAGVIHCPGSNCQVPINDAAILRYLQAEADADTKKLYQRGIANTFVGCDDKLQWCSNPSCGNVVKVTDLDYLVGVSCPIVQCSCGSKFCFFCGSNPHEPITCKMLAKWNAKNKDDSETVHWKMVNTKHCPKCAVPIEKNGGCNHMVCTKVGCRFEFCWICLGNWSNHGYAGANGNCNRFNSAGSSAKNEPNEALTLLQRYLHYYNLYRAHQQSLDSETKNMAKINRKIECFVESSVCTWVDAKFVFKAIEVLRACRLTLIHTYAFAYFIEKNNQQQIFEENQTDLHNAVENLSFFLENDFTGAKSIEYLVEALSQANETNTPERLGELTQQAMAELHEMKTFIINKSTYCDQRRQALLKHIEEGNSPENCWWKYTL